MAFTAKEAKQLAEMLKEWKELCSLERELAALQLKQAETNQQIAEVQIKQADKKIDIGVQAEVIFADALKEMKREPVMGRRDRKRAEKFCKE